MTQLHLTDDLTFHATHLHSRQYYNTRYLQLPHGSCFVYYSPELLPSRNPSTNRKMIEKDRTFSGFALSCYSLYYTSAVSEQSRYYMSMVLLIAQTGSRTRQHNYEFNGVWVNRTDVAWRHLPLAWQLKNLIELTVVSLYMYQRIQSTVKTRD